MIKSVMFVVAILIVTAARADEPSTPHAAAVTPQRPTAQAPISPEEAMARATIQVGTLQTALGQAQLEAIDLKKQLEEAQKKCAPEEPKK